jgi:glycosyltransferase involved in cell wall biosynthesis
VKVLVNAASVKEGGPLVVLDQLLQRMPQQRPDLDLVLALHPSVRRQWSGQKNITEIEVGDIDAAGFGVPYWYEMALPAVVNRIKADVVFSITNYLPLRRLPVATVLLVQHAGHFSKRFDQLTREYLRRPDRVAAWAMKTRWVVRSIRTADEVTVQTSVLADAIAAKTKRPRENIRVIPHGPGAVSAGRPVRPDPRRQPVRIGYPTKWGVQKNFEVLFEAAARLIERGRQIRVVLTLAPDLAENQRIIRSAKTIGIGAIVENVGEVSLDQISSLYDSLDIFAYPSFVESFGFPLVEAMTKGLPVVAADTPSNREVASDAGLFFPPTDAQALAELLDNLIDNPSRREASAAAALRRARVFSWELAAERTLALLDAARMRRRLDAAHPARDDALVG